MVVLVLDSVSFPCCPLLMFSVLQMIHRCTYTSLLRALMRLNNRMDRDVADIILSARIRIWRSSSQIQLTLWWRGFIRITVFRARQMINRDSDLSFHAREK